VVSLTCDSVHNSQVIAAVDGSGCVKIWQRDNKCSNDFITLQEINIHPSQMPKDLSFKTLEDKTDHSGALLICMGCVDYKIRCWVSNYRVTKSSASDGMSYDPFIEVASLSGHEDWVTVPFLPESFLTIVIPIIYS